MDARYPQNSSTTKGKRILDWCLSKPTFFEGLLLGILTNGVVLTIVTTLWLTSQNKISTTTLARQPVLRWKSVAITIAGMTNAPGSNASQLNFPVDMALGSSNTIYIADYYNHRVQKCVTGASACSTIAGQTNATSGSNAAGLNMPTGIYVDSDENIYVADSNNQRVQLWTNRASAGTTVGGTGSFGSSNSQLENPYGIVQDPHTKRLYVADYLNTRVMMYTSGSSTGSVVAGGNGLGINNTQLYNPIGIYFDSTTNSLVIANSGYHNIVRWILGAESWTIVAGNIRGLLGNTSSMLNTATGVTLDLMGNVYVADTLNHRIQFFPVGQTEGITIGGVTGVSGSSSIYLSSPYTVRLDSQLNLYVVDTANHRIQKFLRY